MEGTAMIGRALGFMIALGLAMGAVAPVSADTYPSRPIRMLVPFPPGGAPDIVARMVGDKIAAALGQRVVAENKPGAGGNIASEAAAQAAPDGYTLYLAAHPPFTLNPILYERAPYDAIRDFAPVALVGSQWFMVAVNPQALPVRSIQELAAYAKARPGQLSYASSGAGSPQHLGMEFLKLALGLDIVHVPYKGASLATVDLVNGIVPMALTSVAVARAHLDSGKILPLAVTSRTRAAAYPNLPTVAETVAPNYEVTAWFGVVAPAKTDPEIVRKVNRAVVAGMAEADVRERFVALGLDVLTSTPEEMAGVVRSEVATWKRVVEEAKIKVE
jgi:tripartite-type tricarboxylate transporter receptor subunit TctC